MEVGNLEECISNNFGSWKEQDDADTLEMEVIDYVTSWSVF